MRLDALKYCINKNDDVEDKGSGGSGGGGGGHGGTLGPPPPKTPQQEMDEIIRRLDYLKGNTPNVSPDNTRLQNSKTIARKNNERFINKKVKKRQKENLNIPKGIVNKRKSSINFNFPDTPPQTPPPIFYYDADFPPLSREPSEPQLSEPRETSFLFPDGNLLPLRNRLRTLPSLFSKPSVDNFSRPVTQITDEKNNTIAITPKIPVLPPTN